MFYPTFRTLGSKIKYFSSYRFHIFNKNILIYKEFSFNIFGKMLVSSYGVGWQTTL